MPRPSSRGEEGKGWGGKREGHWDRCVLGFGRAAPPPPSFGASDGSSVINWACVSLTGDHGDLALGTSGDGIALGGIWRFWASIRAPGLARLTRNLGQGKVVWAWNMDMIP